MAISKQDMVNCILKMYAICQKHVDKAELGIDIEPHMVITAALTIGITNANGLVIAEFRDLDGNLVFLPLDIDVPTDECKLNNICSLSRASLEKFNETALSKILNIISARGLCVKFISPRYDELQPQIMACKRHIQELYVRSRQIGKSQQLMSDISHSMHDYLQLSSKQFVRIEIVPKHFNCVEELCVWFDMQII